MRRQNPPQAHIDNAVEVENFLRPARIVGAYAILSALYVALIASAYAVFAHDALVNTSAQTTALFLVAAIVPLLLAVVFCIIRPRDPVSMWLNSIARQWRTPLALKSEDHTFKELLGDGDGLCIKLSLYYPVKDHSQEIRDQLYLYVNGALARECSMRIVTPTMEQIEAAVEPALEMVASERNILVGLWRILASHPISRFQPPRAIARSGSRQEHQEENRGTGSELWRSGNNAVRTILLGERRGGISPPA